jgi:hypothetical protein
MHGLEIVPSKGDYNQTTGIFGNSNGNKTDDLVFTRNTAKVANNLEEFFESFKFVYLKKNLLFIRR